MHVMNACSVFRVILVAACVVRETIPSSHFGNRDDISMQIVGGTQAELGDLPWQVSLFRYSAGQHVCGGSILTENWILTAGHCVHRVLADDILVSAGLVYLSTPGPTLQSSNVSRVIVHEQFNPDLGSFGGSDLALLKLSANLSWNQYVSTIDLPSSSDYIADGMGLVSGWGAVEESGPISNVLNLVEVPVLSLAVCKEYYADDMTANLICAGYDQGGQDACQGDSGGPLACRNKTLLCGVVSAGDGCAREGVPGIYTNVAFYLDWLLLHMN